MYINSDYFMLFNLLVVIAILIAVLIGYKKGMVYEILSLLSFVIAIILAYILSPIFAKHFTIFNIDGDFTANLMSAFINQIVWFVIIIIAIKLIFSIIIPLTSIISKLPLIGFVNRILGAFVGLFNGFIWVLLLSLILSTPFFKNGNEIKDNTLIKYVNVISDKMMVTMIDHFNNQEIIDEFNSHGFSIDDIRNDLEMWLDDKGAFN